MGAYEPPDDQYSDNPYAPPQSEFVPEALPELVAGMPFTIGDVFNWSWSIFKEKMWLCMSIFWGAAMLNWASSFGLSLGLQVILAGVRDAAFVMVAIVLVNFAKIVINIWLVIGQGRAYLKIARRQPVAFQEIFQGGRFVPTTFHAGFVYGVILVVPAMIAVGVISVSLAAMANQSAGGLVMVLAVGSLAAFFVIYVSARLVMFYYLVIDRNAGAIDSLRQSWQLCQNQVGTIIVVFLLQMAIILAGLLALCVGLIIAVPFSGMFLPVTYLALTGTSTSRPQKPEFIWEGDL